VETIVKTITITIKLTDREHDLLVAAKSDKPHPERMRALLVAEARSTLRRMISMVDDERNGPKPRELVLSISKARAKRPSSLRPHHGQGGAASKPNHSDRSSLPTRTE
jgi:hypothetical protein